MSQEIGDCGESFWERKLGKTHLLPPVYCIKHNRAGVFPPLLCFTGKTHGPAAHLPVHRPPVRRRHSL
jgi:hypothetical protein